MKMLRILLIGLAFSGLSATAYADEGRVYKDGPVIDVSYIRTKPGRFDDYMKFLSTTYRTLMEANKKAGLILDYAIYSATPRSPQDPDLLLVDEPTASLDPALTSRPQAHRQRRWDL